MYTYASSQIVFVTGPISLAKHLKRVSIKHFSFLSRSLDPYTLASAPKPGDLRLYGVPCPPKHSVVINKYDSTTYDMVSKTRIPIKDY